MRVLNDYKLVNVRVSQPTFEFIKNNAPYIEDRIPSECHDTKSILKDKVAICHDFDLEKMAQILENASLKVGTQYAFAHTDIVTRGILQCKAEIMELFAVMKRGGYIFAHIMAE